MRFRFLNMKMKIENMKGESHGMNNLNRVKINRNILYDEIWKLSVAGVAKKYNLHYSKLIKSLKENNIPYPSSGYWTRLACGKDVTSEIIPLPESVVEEIYLYPADCSSIKKNENTKNDIVEKVDKSGMEFLKLNKSSKSITSSKEEITIPSNILSFLDENERIFVILELADVHVNNNCKLHPVLVAYKKSIEEWKQEEKENRYIRSNYAYKRRKALEQPVYINEVSDAGLNRVIAILDVIYKKIEKLGGKIKPDLSMIIRKDIVKVTFAEGQDKKEHELTKQEAKELLEYKEKLKLKKYASKPQIRKYDYFYNGKLRVKFENGCYIRDNEHQKLEDRLEDIIIELYGISEEHRILREKREEEHRKYLEEKRQAEQRAARIEEERTHTQALINEAKDHQIACEIRKYVDSVKHTVKMSEKLTKWVEWAEKKADWFDPITAREDEYLGKREHALAEEEKQLVKLRDNNYYY